MLNDLHYAFRQLLKAPSFTIVAIVTIALGIGANTAIFSVVSGVLLSPLPYPDPGRLVSLFEEIPNFKNGSISYPNFLDWQHMNRSFSSLAAYREHSYNLSGKSEPEHLQGEMISAGLFEMLGVRPLVGRAFTLEEDRHGANPTAMISEGLWKRKFAGRQNVLGQVLVIDGVERTVVGVVPSTFRLRVQNFQQGTSFNDIYTPIGEYNEPRFYSDRGAAWGMDAIGRLRPGVSLQQARQDMNRVSQELTATYPMVDSNEKANLVELKEEMVGDMRLTLLVLLSAVFFVLLISCVNVANLLLARSTVRQHEFAVRLAIGAGPSRIVRQLLTESLLLAVLGGGLGLFLAQWGTSLAVSAVPYSLPRAEEIGLDLRVLLFTTFTSLAAGLAFGLAPALKLRSSNLGGTLKQSGRSVSSSHSHTQRVFVVVEVALALVLLVGAGLMIRTLLVLWRLDPGFNPNGVITFSVSPGPFLAKQSPAAIRAFLRQLHEQLATIPDVEAASLSSGTTPMDSDEDWYIWFAGRPKPPHVTDLPMALSYVVEPGYQKALGISLRRGRFLAANDDEHSPPVVVIDETLAEKYFKGVDPIGEYLDLDNNPGEQERRPKARIIGIVGHVNQWGLDSDATNSLHAQIYLSIAQLPDSGMRNIVSGRFAAYVRGKRTGPPDLGVIRQRMRAFNRELIVYEGKSMEQVVLLSIESKRFTLAMLVVFAALALLLAGIGLFGVLSYLVGQRTREIGIRMALGAARGDILRLVLTEGARMTLTGIVIGVGAALALTHFMASMLFGVKPTDVTTFVMVVVTLSAIALIAAYIPAGRASKIDPVIAMRDE